MGLILAAIGVPAVGAVLAGLVAPGARPFVGLATAVATGGAALGLGGLAWQGATPEAIAVRGPVGLEAGFVADGLAVTMVLTTTVVGLLTSAFAAVEGSPHRRYWPLALALWAALHTLFLAGDLFTIYLMLELVGLTGAWLVALAGDRRAVVAGARYFYAELVASLTFLLGVAIVWSQAGTLVIAALPAELAESPAGWWGLALMTAGLVLKVPLVPVHLWLPGAHTLAPAAVSPVLSALVVKTAFAVLARLWLTGLPEAVTPAAAQAVGALGAVAVLWGSFNAVRADRVKLLVAHSTLAHLGLLFLLPPLALAGSWAGWVGGVLHAITHALPKAALLMVATLLARSAGSDRLDDLVGSASRRPVATLAFGVAAVSLVGLPPTGGFVAKWYLLVASVETGQWWWVPVIVVGSLLSAVYLMRVVKRAFAPPVDGLTLAPVRGLADAVALALALLALLLGLYPAPLLQLLEAGAPIAGAGG